MTESGGSTPLNAYVYTASNDPNKLIPNNEAWLTAKAQLKPSTTYNMALHGTINGNEFGCIGGKIVFGKTPGCFWSFTTASGCSISDDVNGEGHIQRTLSQFTKRLELNSLLIVYRTNKKSPANEVEGDF